MFGLETIKAINRAARCSAPQPRTQRIRVKRRAKDGSMRVVYEHPKVHRL